MMSDGMLSQDEIDALLRGTADPDGDNMQETDGGNNEDPNVDHDRSAAEEYLTPIEKDALGEIGNISFGSSATALSTLLNQKVEITTPSVTIVKKENLAAEFPIPYVGIQVSYTDGFSGTNLLVIRQNDAAIIADLMLGGDGTNPPEMMDEIQLSAVQEAMNQMMGSAATSMSTVFNKRVDISPPTIAILDVKENQGTDQLPGDELLVKVSFRLKVGTLIDSTIMQLLPIDFSKNLVSDLMNPGQTATAAQHDYDSLDMEESQPTASGGGEKWPKLNMKEHDGSLSGTSSSSPKQVSYSSEAQTMGAGNPKVQQPSPQHVGMAFQGKDQPVIQPAVFSNFAQQPLPQAEAKNLSMLLDIPLQVTVELGSTSRSVKEILELSTGSIIELDKLAGEPVDILINNRLIAKGEVVVIDENFGVRVTDIISQTDRINKLR